MLQSSAFQLLSHLLVSILHHFPLGCVYTVATCDRCSTLWILHILGVDSHATDSVTHNDKVIITKGGQQMGPTINHVAVAAFHNF